LLHACIPPHCAQTEREEELLFPLSLSLHMICQGCIARNRHSLAVAQYDVVSVHTAPLMVFQYPSCWHYQINRPRGTCSALHCGVARSWNRQNAPMRMPNFTQFWRSILMSRQVTNSVKKKSNNYVHPVAFPLPVISSQRALCNLMRPHLPFTQDYISYSTNRRRAASKRVQQQWRVTVAKAFYISVAAAI
jgi:hypothetical protein